VMVQDIVMTLEMWVVLSQNLQRRTIWQCALREKHTSVMWQGSDAPPPYCHWRIPPSHRTREWCCEASVAVLCPQ
jgi:hypothetical protein